jgi:formylglycine-generating enzyme required for sulfatase activity
MPETGDTLSNSIGMIFVQIPIGEFTMGTPFSEDPSALSEERPQHRVRITQPFYLAVYEVTQTQYQRVMGTTPNHRLECGGDAAIENLSWEDARSFCQKLGELPAEGLAGRTYRLPSEAEWEYACRAGGMTRYSFGDSAEVLGDYAWYKGNSEQERHAVGQRKPNAWGLYDMHGNVWEWCDDVHADYHEYAVDANQCPSSYSRSSSNGHVLRGGCWLSDAFECRAGKRRFGSADLRVHDFGFRVVCVTPEK